MLRIMFVCHGNICRSPMAEFVFRDMVEKRGYGGLFYIASSATSNEEIGSGVHPGTKKKLKEHGISAEGKYAAKLHAEDYPEYDYFLGMDTRNIANMNIILGWDYGKKIHRLLDFTKRPRDIEDPWYTGDFDTTYKDVLKGCEAFLDFCLSHNKENLYVT